MLLLGGMLVGGRAGYPAGRLQLLEELAWREGLLGSDGIVEAKHVSDKLESGCELTPGLLSKLFCSGGDIYFNSC